MILNLNDVTFIAETTFMCLYALFNVKIFGLVDVFYYFNAIHARDWARLLI